MIKSKSVKVLEKSNVTLSVTIDKDGSSAAYHSLLTEYSKKAQIKGFRPGKVPVSVLETKFGDSIKEEAAQNLIEESLKDLFEEIDEKPLPYARPSLEGELNFIPGEEFTFAVTYDVFPKFTVQSPEKLSVEEPQVEIGDSDLAAELEQIREQNAIVADSSEGIKQGDVVTVDHWELDESGAQVAGSKRESLTFTIGAHQNIYHMDDDIIGMKKDESKVIAKSYEADFHEAELAGKSIKLEVSIKRVRSKNLPALDDELAQDVDEKFKTLEDLKKDIRTKMQTTADSRLRQQKIQSLMDQYLAVNNIVLPKSMVDAELYQKWTQMVRQFGGKEDVLMQVMQSQGTTIDQLFEEWRPGTEKDLKANLIEAELVKAAGITVEDAEIEVELNRQAEGSRTSYEETKEYFEQNKMMDWLKSNVESRKLWDLTLAKAKVTKGAKVKYVDLIGQKS